MTAIVLPRIWPPQHWASRQRLTDPAEALWSELRMARGAIDVVDLMIRALDHCEALFASRGDAFRRFDELLTGWVARNLVSVTGHPSTYRLAREYMPLRSPPPPPSPRPSPFPKRTQRQRLWSAMKVLRSFDLPTLLMTTQANRPAALDMLRNLERGGWLQRTHNGWTTSAARTWGSVAPTFSRLRDGTAPLIRITDQRDGTVIDIPLRGKLGRVGGQDRWAESLENGGVS